MEKFKPKTVIVLKRTGNKAEMWGISVGHRIKTWCSGFYLVWQKTYRAMEDKSRITKIEITVTREK